MNKQPVLFTTFLEFFFFSKVIPESWVCGLYKSAAYMYMYMYVHYSTHDEFDSVDPSSMQDTCHIWTQLNGLALHEFS